MYIYNYIYIYPGEKSTLTLCFSLDILGIEEILHQLIGSFPSLFTGCYTSQVVQEFFHQQFWGCLTIVFLE